MTSVSVNIRTDLLREIWIFAGISTVIVLLRIAAKARIGKLALDDCLIVFALVSKPSMHKLSL